MADSFQSLITDFSSYGYPLLFAGVLLESAGVPLPGETVVLTAGFLSSPAGGGHFSLFWVITLTALAAMLGDNLGYELGRRLARPRLQQGHRFFFLTPELMARAEGYFQRYGIWTIFFGRFVAALRVAAALAAGTAGMSWPRFFVANAAGAVTWAIAIALLGYFFGSSISVLHEWLGRGSAVVIGCVVLLVGLPYLLRRARRLPLETYVGNQMGRTALVLVLEVACIALLVLLAQGHHATHVDRHVATWVADHQSETLEVLAAVGSYFGALPIAMAVVATLLVVWYRLGRPRREMAVAVAVLIACEAVGWLVIGLLRGRNVEPLRAEVWPFGFAGVAPLRAAAVFGFTAYLLARQWPLRGLAIHAAATVLIALTGLGVLWGGRQTFTEVLVEYAAGAVVLFAAVWRLEGHGRVAELKASIARKAAARENAPPISES